MAPPPDQAAAATNKSATETDKAATETDKAAAETDKVTDKVRGEAVLAKMHEMWRESVARRTEATRASNIREDDVRRLKPSDIGVEFGPVMTEEQFARYRADRARQGAGVRVVK